MYIIPTFNKIGSMTRSREQRGIENGACIEHLKISYFNVYISFSAHLAILIPIKQSLACYM